MISWGKAREGWAGMVLGSGQRAEALLVSA